VFGIGRLLVESLDLFCLFLYISAVSASVIRIASTVS
jgi:hypothetical protein